MHSGDKGTRGQGDKEKGTLLISTSPFVTVSGWRRDPFLRLPDHYHQLAQDAVVQLVQRAGYLCLQVAALDGEIALLPYACPPMKRDYTPPRTPSTRTAMDTERVKAIIRQRRYKTSYHAEVEREAETITIDDIKTAILVYVPTPPKWLDPRTRASRK
jgi:hypothetical protein